MNQHIIESRISDDAIATLRDEAGAAGDLEQVAICTAALDGDDGARDTCASVVADARAMDEETA